MDETCNLPDAFKLKKFKFKYQIKFHLNFHLNFSVHPGNS